LYYKLVLKWLLFELRHDKLKFSILCNARNIVIDRAAQ